MNNSSWTQYHPRTSIINKQDCLKDNQKSIMTIRKDTPTAVTYQA